MTYTFKLSRRLALGQIQYMLAVLILLAACTSSSPTETTSGPDGDAALADIVVSPRRIVLEPNQSFALQALRRRVSATEPVTAEWTSSGGTITADGVFSAEESGTYKVVGKGRGRAKRDTTIVVVSPTPETLEEVSISPDTARVLTTQYHLFTARGVLSDGSEVETAVTWQATGGSIDAGGLYSAGPETGRYRVIAKSVSREFADTAEVLIEPSATVPVATALLLSPGTISVAAGSTEQFSAVLQLNDGSTAPVGVRYEATGGTITAGGLYTAGATAGSFRVVAVDSGGALADTAVVTVVAGSAPAPCAEPCVSAGGDVTGSVGQPVGLQGQAPSGWKVVWSVVSGPRRGKFAHESFVSDFEEGTIGEWTGTPIQQQCNQQLGPDGAQGGNGSRVTTGRPHTGSYGWEAYNNPNDCDSIGKYSAKLLRWRFPWTQWYAEGWFWWPPEYNLAATSGGGYLNLMQWKEGASPYDPTAIIAVTGRYTGTDEFILHDYKTGTFTRLGATVPKGRWVHLAAWVKATTSGELWVWVDGKLITRQTGLNVRGNTPAGANMMWGVGNYSQYGMGQRLWWDDVSAANDAGQMVTPTFLAPAAGTYVVRMTASDGTSSRTDETTVTIR